MEPLTPVQRLLQPWARLLLALWLLPLTLGAAPENPREYAIKAAYLFHFTQFIEWPADALPPAGEPLQIGVLPPDPFGVLLEEIVRDQKVKDHLIKTVDLNNFDEAATCQIVFAPRFSTPPPQETIEALAGKPVLMVGEELAFLYSGGMIALVTEEDRVVIAINRAALEKAGLNASARLLRLARLVEVPPAQ